MPGRVLLRWVPPPPVKEGSGKSVRYRQWDVDRIIRWLQEALEPQVQEAFDAELVIVQSKIPEIRPERLAAGVKADEVRTQVGEWLSTLMEDFEGDDYLLNVEKPRD